MIEVRRTEEFAKWLKALRDQTARAKILVRIQRVEAGNFGDVKFFDGIGELRITHGPGYRVYFMQHGQVMVILLCGGDKSTQDRDIANAKAIAREI